MKNVKCPRAGEDAVNGNAIAHFAQQDIV